MEFQFWPAVFAGLVGGLVMSMLDWMMKPMGMRMDPHHMWGTMMKLRGGAGYTMGLVVHLVLSAAIALLYALFFDIVGAEQNLWAWGLLGGVIHWAIAGGMVMPMVPAMHPEIPEREPAPGMFVKNYGGLDAMGFLMSHLLYGLVVGIIYALFA
jgi:uncharacterized membrane protein YagU involved in acid resistance